MTKSFAGEVVSFSAKYCAIIALIMLPMLVFVWIIQTFNLRMVTRFNLFFVFLIIVFGVVYLVGRLIGSLKMPKLLLKKAQWETALGVVSWIKSHETANAFLFMLGILVAFVPISLIWGGLNSIGALNSDVSAFGFLFLLVLPFFLIPSLIISSIYESIVHPENPSLSQVEKIISALYSCGEHTGEMLENAKYRFVSIPDKRTKNIGAVALALITCAMVILELIELDRIPKEYNAYLPFIFVVVSVLAVGMFLMNGKKKSELDLWINSTKENRMSTELDSKSRVALATNARNFFKLSPNIEKTISAIEKSWIYRLAVILGASVTFVSAILWLIGFL